MSLAGARVLVVGASAGIGKEIGLAAARAGAGVVFSARRKDRLEEAAEEAGSGHAVVIDVTDPDSVASGLSEAVRSLGGLDIVVYTSGMASIAPLLDETEDNWRRMFDTNVVGAASVTKAALGHLGRGGILFFTSSVSTQRRLWGLSAYAATKAAFDRLVDGLRDEHPQVRFVRATIGNTIGTEFGNNFDGAILTEALTRWVVTGHQPAAMMSAPDVAAVAAGILALLRAHPDVDIPHLQLEPPGGLLTLPPTTDVLSRIFASPPGPDDQGAAPAT